MREFRSRSQILFGFLPEQTVDLRGRVWRITSWEDPVRRVVDDDALRSALLGGAAPWGSMGRDNGMIADLRRGRTIEVRSLSLESGVRVTAFPRVWLCKVCQRGSTSEEQNCRCGARRWAQLHFVGYHGCGALREPFLPRCPTHREVRVIFPGTASAAEIRMECPVCTKILRRGLGMPTCECGEGRIQYTVHRAASVYTPRTVVVVLPLSPERRREISEAGGPTRALDWVLNGLAGSTLATETPTRATFIRQMVSQGLSSELAATLADQAVRAGELSDEVEADGVDLAENEREAAEREAVTVASALSESRIRLDDLAGTEEGNKSSGSTYAERCSGWLSRGRLEAVELIDTFPVLTGVFGYTRGDSTPGATRLIPFRSKSGSYVVYGEMANTEALFVRLGTEPVAAWLKARGFGIGGGQSRRIRLAVLRNAQVPSPGESFAAPTMGTELLTLVHSLSHRLIREAALHSGIERTSLSELLVPLHLGFFVYAAAKGDFVLGGLQAVFESDLDRLLEAVVADEHRCPLDPACSSSGGACVACLHLGEPSCRYYNRYLDRRVLWGHRGYFDG